MNRLELILGIDPGKTGAWALYTPATRSLLCVEDLPIIGKHLNGVDLVNSLSQYDITFAIIEAVSAMPKNGAVSSFTFGRNFGGCLGILQALRIPYAMVAPTKWKSAMRLSSDKDLSRQRATELFPSQAERFKRKMDDGRSEAVLLSVYAAEFHSQYRTAA